MIRVRSIGAGVALLIFVGAEEAQGESTVAQTIGFEVTDNWQLVEGAGTLALAPALSEGTSALLLGGAYWRRIRSGPVAFDEVDESIGIDVALSANAAGWETVGLTVEIPSAGLYWSDLGQQSVAGLSAGEVRTLRFMLPAPVRSALQAGNGAYLSVAVNGAQAFTVDHLSVGATSPPDVPPVSVAKTCQSHDLQIVDVRGDFRDIWAGREDAATGKRTSQFPNIEIQFDRPIDARRLSARLVGYTGGTDAQPSDCLDVNGDPVAIEVMHQVRFFAGTGADAWRVPIAGGDSSIPLDFNIVAFEDIDGVPDSWGAIAAGGDVTLSNVSVNGESQQPLAIVVGGVLSVTNGTIYGDVAYGAEPPQLHSVTLTGQLHPELPVDFAELREGLLAMSDSLGSAAALGAAVLNYSQLTLSGTDPELNVFDVDSSVLSQATGITLSVPTASAALINVRGVHVTLQNLQVTLNGFPRSSLLWNFPDASELTLRSVSFPGSVLAPTAGWSTRRKACFGQPSAGSARASKHRSSRRCRRTTPSTRR